MGLFQRVAKSDSDIMALSSYTAILGQYKLGVTVPLHLLYEDTRFP